MLLVQKIRDALNTALDESGFWAFALINTSGAVLDSRESKPRPAGSSDEGAQNAENNVNNKLNGYTVQSGSITPRKDLAAEPVVIDAEHELFSMDPKLQTKIYAIFAAELWKKSRETIWVGAEVQNRRLLLRPLQAKDLLLLVIASDTQTWEEIEKSAFSTALQLVDISV